MKCVAIIPARGGSKRIPRKNIKSFLGKPMIAYSIETAKASGLFDRIIVSTDDEEVASVARQYGAEIPFIRPRELSDDFTGTAAVVNHCIEWLKESGSTFDFVCCIYATAPFVQSKYLKQGIDALVSSDHEYSFSITSFPFPIQRAVQIIDGLIYSVSVEDMQKRSQDLTETYHDAGQFYWYKMKDSKGVPSSPECAIPVILPRYFVQDIDTEEDWDRAEAMYEVLVNKGLLS